LRQQPGPVFDPRPKGETGKVAICAQGCVSRNINILIQENQIKRDQVHVIGVPSPENGGPPGDQGGQGPHHPFGGGKRR
jgi:hypothetical protein